MEKSVTGKVVKNTFMLYVRMLFLMLSSFYCSRILLSTFGVEDFGIYSVVGSILSTFIAIKSLFSESVQRFLNVAKGRSINSIEEQMSIFNTSVIIHIILVVIFVIIVEVIGLWLLYNKLNIPDGRFDAAYVVFQMTIMATAISILCIPFDALIIANEKFGAYAAISIIDGTLKLIFVVVLPLIGYDYLKTYSILMVSIPIIIFVLQFCYCRRFPECVFKFQLNKSLFKQMMSLSSWNFFGNISFSLIHEGINMLLNMFGGVVVNAARYIAYQVKGLTSQISINTMVALRPMVMQQSVSKTTSEYFDTIILVSRIAMFAMFVLAVPIFVFCPQLLEIWLGTVPEYSVLFTRIILLSIVFRSLHEPFNMMHMAFGSIKRMMSIESIIMLSFLILTYIVVSRFNIIWLPFVFLSVMEIVIILFLLMNAKLELNYSVRKYCRKVLFPMSLIITTSAAVSFIFIEYSQPNSLLSLLFYFMLLFSFVCILILAILDSKEKLILKNLLLQLLSKNEKTIESKSI